MLQALPGRECGDCNACCVELAIDDPELQKPDEVACPNLADGRCCIYQRRPRTCRDWFCGWRLIALSDAMRPDRSGVLLIPEMGSAPGYQRGGLKLAPLGGDLAALLQDEIVDLSARCIVRDIPIFLTCGGGADARRLMVNDRLKDLVLAGDRAAFVAGLAAAVASLEAYAGQGPPGER